MKNNFGLTTQATLIQYLKGKKVHPTEDMEGSFRRNKIFRISCKFKKSNQKIDTTNCQCRLSRT